MITRPMIRIAIGLMLTSCVMPGAQPVLSQTSVVEELESARRNVLRIGLLEEVHFAMHRRYASLPVIGFEPSPDVVIQFARDVEGWFAVATSVGGTAQCVGVFGSFRPGISRPESRVSPPAQGVSCVPSAPAEPQPRQSATIQWGLFDLVNRPAIVALRGPQPVGAWRAAVAAGSDGAELADSIGHWVTALESHIRLWSEVDGYDRLLQEALSMVDSVRIEATAREVARANWLVRLADMQLANAVGRFRASPAYERYRPSGSASLRVTTLDLRTDDELAYWIGDLDETWRLWIAAYMSRREASVLLGRALHAELAMSGNPDG